MEVGTGFSHPGPRPYEIYFEREEDAENLAYYGVEPTTEVFYHDGHASTAAMLTSDQRARLSKYARLRPAR